MGKKLPDRVRIQHLQNRVKDLEDKLARINRENRLLKNQANLITHLAGDNAAFAKVIEDYLGSLHTLALMADPSRAVSYDAPKVATSGRGAPAYDHRAAWAANRLDQEIQHFYDLQLDLNAFLLRPHPVPPVKTRKRYRCDNCQLPHCSQTQEETR